MAQIFGWEGAHVRNNIFEYSTAGVLLQTIPIGFSPGGIGYDQADNTLWVGTFGDVIHLDLSGNVLGSFSAGNAFHDGLEMASCKQPQCLSRLA